MSINKNVVSSLLIDETGRRSIISDLDKNLFVIAGAGSGKTTMLVNRMVAMVESGEFDISKICAITFTKKAAAEFLLRFQSKLKERSKKPYPVSKGRPGDLPTPNDITAERCRKALEKIDLCFTGTIDSFCNLVLSEYPNNAKIPSSSMVIEDDEFIELCKKGYEKIANDVNSPIKDKFDAFNQLFSNGADIFSKSIKDVMDVSHLDIQYVRPTKSLEEAVKDLANKYEKKIQDDIETLISLESDVNTSKQAYIDQFQELKRAKKQLLDKWTVRNFTSIKSKINSVFKEELRFNSQPTLKFFEFVPVSKHFKCRKKGDSQVLKEYYDAVDSIVYTYALDFLVSAAEFIKDNLRKQGKLSFTEYLMIFRNMIVEDINNGMKLINHIRNKHSYFLIDESQDTSPAQTELFIYLASEVEAHTLKDCKPIPGSLFIVGDPKQSIYGFRGADVNAYLNTKTLFESVYDQRYNKVVYLTQNFRSNLELCSYFNDKFKGLANFEPIPLVNKNITPSNCLSGLYSSTDYKSAIEALVGKHYILDKEGNRRLIEYKDIMLLTWTTTSHDKILKNLKDNNIPVYCEGKFYIKECEILETIYAIYAYVSRGKGQLYNLLSSPLFNAVPNSLLSIRNIDDIPDGLTKDLLNRIELLKSVDNPVILIEKIVESLRLYRYINYTDMEYLNFTVEKFKEAYSSQKISDIISGEKILRDFILCKLERCMNMEDVPNAVNLANVHKVKGLEKPVVILAYTIKASRKPNNDSDYSNNKAYVFKTAEYESSSGSKGYNISCGDLFTSEEIIATNKKDEEELRLGYVAVTRARNLLIFPEYKVTVQNPWINVQVEGLPLIPSSSLPGPSVVTAGSFNFDDPSSFNNTESYWQKSPSKEAHIASRYDEAEKESITSTSDIDSRTKGTIIHRLMEKIINSKGKLDKSALIQGILDEYSLNDKEEYKNILESVYTTMFNGGYPQKNGAPQDLLPILFKSECYTEVPFSFKEGKMIWQGEIDLLYIYENKYYIVDYKTNIDDEKLEETYSKQLEAYRKALKISLGVDAVTYIYHIGD